MAPSYTLRCLYLNILLTSGSVAAYPLQRATVGGTDARQQDDHVYEKRGVVLLNDVQESSSSEVLIARFDSRQYTTASWPSQPTWSGYSTSAWWTPSDSWTTSFTGAASTTNIFQSASTYMTATSETSEPSIASSTSSSASSTTSSYIYSTTTSTTLSSSTPTASPSSSSTELPTAVTTSSSSSSTTTSKPTSTSAFNPTASDNVAVYYGQTDQTSDISLDLICADPNVDIVVLAFVTTFFSPGGWPTLNLGPECGPATSAQTATGASGLLDCVSYGFAAQITQCQAAGKKVMMSLGGAAGYSDTTIASASDAQALAQTLFDLFLEPGSNNTTLAIRPFGDVVLDGFDVDNESGTTLYIDTLIQALRNLYQSSTHQYYLSAAPQCPQPDASIPLDSLTQTLDFVWVQFYNNPSCNFDTGSDFISSLSSWSTSISTGPFQTTNNGVTSPRLYVGGPAFATAGSGFVEMVDYGTILQSVTELGLSNLGGVMLWDGAYGEESAAAQGADSYMAVAKGVLG